MRCPRSLRCLLVLPVVLTTGCAAASAVASALGAALSGLTYLADGNAERTFVTPLPEVWRASLTVLRLMDLTITEGTRRETAGELTATAPDLTVTFTLRSVTARATRVMIDAGNGGLSRDRATAAEVLNQLALLLPAAPAAAHVASHPPVPPPQEPRVMPAERPRDLEEPEGEGNLFPRDEGDVGGEAADAGLLDGRLPGAGEGGSWVGEECSPPRSHQEDPGEAGTSGGDPSGPPEDAPRQAEATSHHQPVDNPVDTSAAWVMTQRLSGDQRSLSASD